MYCVKSSVNSWVLSFNLKFILNPTTFFISSQTTNFTHLNTPNK